MFVDKNLSIVFQIRYPKTIYKQGGKAVIPQIPQSSVVKIGDYLPQCAELLKLCFDHFPSKKELREFIQMRARWGHYVCSNTEIAARVAYVNYDWPDLRQAFIDYERAQLLG